MEQIFWTGKFWAVFVIVLMVLIGLFLYLWRLDRKISNLENNISNEKL